MLCVENFTNKTKPPKTDKRKSKRKHFAHLIFLIMKLLIFLKIFFFKKNEEIFAQVKDTC
jgi:hypothetical protein